MEKEAPFRSCVTLERRLSDLGGRCWMVHFLQACQRFPLAKSRPKLEQRNPGQHCLLQPFSAVGREMG